MLGASQVAHIAGNIHGIVICSPYDIQDRDIVSKKSDSIVEMRKEQYAYGREKIRAADATSAASSSSGVSVYTLVESLFTPSVRPLESFSELTQMVRVQRRVRVGLERQKVSLGVMVEQDLMTYVCGT